MPDVRNMVLAKAVKEVRKVTGSAELDLRIFDRRNGQDVHNQTNWVVCHQAPPSGEPISQKNKKVFLYVKRFNQKSCWS